MTFDQQTYGASIVGTPLVVRQYGLAAWYDVPPCVLRDDGNWKPYHRWVGQWQHVDYPHHVVCVEDDGLSIAKVTAEEPYFDTIFELGRVALGDEACPKTCRAGALSVRIAMRIVGNGFAFPERDFRERRLLPARGQPPKVLSIGGYDAELRVSATRFEDSLHVYTAVYPSRVYERRGVQAAAVRGKRSGSTRQAFFPGDGRYTPDLDEYETATERAKQTVGMAIAFAHSLKSEGLMIDAAAHVDGRPIGEIVTRNGELGIDVKLPILFDASDFFLPLSEV